MSQTELRHIMKIGQWYTLTQLESITKGNRSTICISLRKLFKWKEIDIRCDRSGGRRMRSYYMRLK